MKKTFAVYFFNGNKVGFDAYTYIMDITNEPIRENGTFVADGSHLVATRIFSGKTGQLPDGFKKFGCPVKINGTKYADMISFYKKGNGLKEIVLAERITNNNQPQTKKGT